MSYSVELMVTTLDEPSKVHTSSDGRKTKVMYECNSVPFIWVSMFDESDYFEFEGDCIPFCSISKATDRLHNSAEYLDSLFLQKGSLVTIIEEFIDTFTQHKNRNVFISGYQLPVPNLSGKVSGLQKAIGMTSIKEEVPLPVFSRRIAERDKHLKEELAWLSQVDTTRTFYSSNYLSEIVDTNPSLFKRELVNATKLVGY